MNAPSKMWPVKLVKVGNSTGVVLPKDMLARLGVEAGDTLNAILDDDSLKITRSDDDFDAQMIVAREVMARRRRALRELAK